MIWLQGGLEMAFGSVMLVESSLKARLDFWINSAPRKGIKYAVLKAWPMCHVLGAASQWSNHSGLKAAQGKGVCGLLVYSIWHGDCMNALEQFVHLCFT